VNKPGPWSAWLPAARKHWRVRLGELDLPWYAQAKFEEGAFAALLGVQFNGSTWHAEAVGDSCLFLVRDEGLYYSFPVRRSRDFSNQPHLLGSRPQNNSGSRTRRLHLEQDWRPGDALFLMTDALAQWFLERVENRQRPWKALLAIETAKNFVGCIERLRNNGMRNDDVTMIRIQDKPAP
jgi:hypothetical protein